jgi:hypothetical protein
MWSGNVVSIPGTGVLLPVEDVCTVDPPVLAATPSVILKHPDNASTAVRHTAPNATLDGLSVT